MLLRLQGGAPKKGKDKKGKDKKGKDKGDKGSKAPLGEVCITPTLQLSPWRLRAAVAAPPPLRRLAAWHTHTRLCAPSPDHSTHTRV